MFDEHFAVILHAVGSGFVEDVDMGEVGFDQRFIKRAETHVGDFVKLNLRGGLAPSQMNSRGDLMHPAGKGAEHGTRGLVVRRFAQGTSVEPDERVGGEDDRGGMRGHDGEGLGPGIGQNERGESERGIMQLHRIRSDGDEFNSSRAEQLVAAR